MIRMKARKLAIGVAIAYPLAAIVTAFILQTFYPTILDEFRWGVTKGPIWDWLPVAVVATIIPFVIVRILWRLDHDAAQGFEVQDAK